MKVLKNIQKFVIIIIIIANIIVIGESLLDLKTDKLFEVYENIDTKYIYKK